MTLRHFAQTKMQRQADRLAKFADAVIAIDARHAGKIDWNTAKYLRNAGMLPADAARQYCRHRPNGPENNDALI